MPERLRLDDGSTSGPDMPSGSQTDPSSAEWAACYRAEMHLVQRYLMHTFNLSNIDDTEDPAHEAFEELFKKWPEVKHPRTWLRTVAFRKMLGHLPKNEVSLDNIIYDPANETASARLMLNEEERAARAAISTLPVTQRQVFSMVFDGFSYSEIAEVLGITEDAARKNMERARAKLRELLT
jgi:RNA polymerase sigma factor (sigma-70 family)